MLLNLILLSISILFSSPSPGSTLFSTVSSMPNDDQIFYTYLLDESGDVEHQWEHEFCVGHTPYLSVDSLLIRPGRITPPFFSAGGIGGIIQKKLDN